jgi:hypothetical protein
MTLTLAQKRELATDKLAVIAAKLEEARSIISELIDEVKIAASDGASNAKSGSLAEACRLYFYLSEEYDKLDEVRKKIGLQLEHMSREVIPDIMTEEETSSITLEDVQRRFTKSTRTTASMADKEAAMAWLRSIGKGDLIQQSVNSSSLSSFAKQFMIETQTELPDSIKVNHMTITSVNKLNRGA